MKKTNAGKYMCSECDTLYDNLNAGCPHCNQSASTPVSIDKEVLEITDEKLEDLAEGNAIMHLQEDEEETHSAARKTGFKDGYVLGYKEAVSNIGKGYNPAAMEELYNALEAIITTNAFQNGYFSPAIQNQALTAINNSKL